jgi:hypothetical protein
MARRNENECAYCAEEMMTERCVVGRDWKVYCSPRCAEAGEALSLREAAEQQRLITPRNEPGQPETQPGRV